MNCCTETLFQVAIKVIEKYVHPCDTDSSLVIEMQVDTFASNFPTPIVSRVGYCRTCYTAGTHVLGVRSWLAWKRLTYVLCQIFALLLFGLTWVQNSAFRDFVIIINIIFIAVIVIIVISIFFSFLSFCCLLCMSFHCATG